MPPTPSEPKRASALAGTNAAVRVAWCRRYERLPGRCSGIKIELATFSASVNPAHQIVYARLYRGLQLLVDRQFAAAIGCANALGWRHAECRRHHENSPARISDGTPAGP